MTAAPVILTLDCDMHSNDPIAPLRALCYFLDPAIAPTLAYVQFPQRFLGLNSGDIYGGEMRRVFRIDPLGMDGLRGVGNFGTCCFFSRRSLYGPPPAAPTNDESKVRSADWPLSSESVLRRAHEAAGCRYENSEEWGNRIGFRYGSLVEDYFTGFRMQCEGWRSVFCDPVERPAFLGQAPKSLIDVLRQYRRWTMGLYQKPSPTKASSSPATPPAMVELHTHHAHPRILFNRLHIFVYAAALLALLYRHTALLESRPVASSLLLLLADLVLALMWLFSQGFRWRPLLRQEFPDRLSAAAAAGSVWLPALDVFVCTADPYKEPPVSVASTALSAMAFDYPAGRLSVYVSDDGCSELTLLAFIEAAKFARYWLPFCREKGIMERSPEAYFESGNGDGDVEEIKIIYEELRCKIERAVQKGYVDDTLITSPEDRQTFEKWKNFTRKDHPAIVQVLLDSSRDTDVAGDPLPNLVYLSREKRRSTPHHFKAGALNALVRSNYHQSLAN
ncbi:Cellulose synthase-like protein G1 [Apostasia shenzhenica]|uniref:Cellulose synthase-like protein G1 n=1 Tax=Apostasia shenzhenica TaxID=1088818 RepID=A0A2I0A935_9ASPA|nr:Cellulose synthase-like protein G1 [Apostasia shenzhenica]